MSFAIGLRFYRIQVFRKVDKENMIIGPGSEPCDLMDFFDAFVNEKRSATVEEEVSRTWFFEPRKTNAIRTIHGYINYGTHGFESKFKDVKTLEEKYQRKTSDVEEIPLYFQIWMPENSSFGLIAFQSFQIRSCITLVRSSIIRKFEHSYLNYNINFRIVAPNSAALDMFPVKTVRFLKPKSSNDRADRYFGRSAEEVDYEVTIKARRRGSIISTYKELRSRLNANKDGLIEFEGQEFESVKADVNIGKKRRTVSVYGVDLDAALIDVSDNIVRDASGHPTLDSIEHEVNELMEDFYKKMT